LFEPADVLAQLTAQVAELAVADHEQAEQPACGVVVNGTGPVVRERRHLLAVAMHRDDELSEGHSTHRRAASLVSHPDVA